MIILLLALTHGLMGQEMSYTDFKTAFIEYQPPQTTWQQMKADPVFIPSVVLVGSFAVNQVLITTTDRQIITRPTTYVFVAGCVLSLALYLHTRKT